jgi:hypothetical protein
MQINMYFLYTSIIHRQLYTAFRVTADSMKNIIVLRNVTFTVIIDYAVGQGSVVGIGTRCRLDGPGIETRWGRETFRTCQTRPWTYPDSYTRDTRSFPA